MTSSTRPSPEVSIIIPAYNAGDYIAANLESILAQTFANLECIVVDDGSRDNTADVAETYAARDSRIRVIRKSNGGVCSARNRGLEDISPQSAYLIFQDADDVYTPEAVQVLYEALATDDTAVGAHALTDKIDKEGNPLNPGGQSSYGRNRVGIVGNRAVAWPADKPTDLAVLAFQTRLYPPGLAMWRRTAVEAAGPFDPDYYVCADMEMFLRLSVHGNIRFVDQVIIWYRQHGNNMSSNREDTVKEKERILKKLYRNEKLSPEQRRIVAVAGLLQQRYKVSMWREAGMHDFLQGKLVKAGRCFAHMGVNAVRYVKMCIKNPTTSS